MLVDPGLYQLPKCMHALIPEALNVCMFPGCWHRLLIQLEVVRSNGIIGEIIHLCQTMRSNLVRKSACHWNAERCTQGMLLLQVWAHPNFGGKVGKRNGEMAGVESLDNAMRPDVELVASSTADSPRKYLAPDPC